MTCTGRDAVTLMLPVNGAYQLKPACNYHVLLMAPRQVGTWYLRTSRTKPDPNECVACLCKMVRAQPRRERIWERIWVGARRGQRPARRGRARLNNHQPQCHSPRSIHRPAPPHHIGSHLHFSAARSEDPLAPEKATTLFPRFPPSSDRPLTRLPSLDHGAATTNS